MLHAADGGADRFGAVAQHHHVHALGQRGLQLWQQGAHAVHHRDHVRAGLALDVDQHRRRGTGPGRELPVLGPVFHRGHVAQAQRCGVAVGQDQLPVLLHRAHLVIGIKHDRAGGAIEAALGQVDVGGPNRVADMRHAQAIGGLRGRVDLDAHRRTLPAGQADQANARQLRQALCHARVDQVIHLRQGQALRSYGQSQNRRVGGIDLAVHRRHRQVVGQETVGGVDRCLHFLLSHAQCNVQGELQGDHRRTPGAGGRHLLQPGNLPQLALQRRGHGTGGHARARAWIQRGHLDDRVVHLRQGGDRQQPIRQHAGQQQRHHQ